MSLGEEDCGIAGDVHRVQLLLLLKCLGIRGEIQCRFRVRDVPLEIQETLPVDLVVEHRVSRCPLLHELGEDPGLVCPVPFLRQCGEDPVAQGAMPPVGDDLSLVALDASVRHDVAGLRP